MRFTSISLVYDTPSGQFTCIALVVGSLYVCLSWQRVMYIRQRERRAPLVQHISTNITAFPWSYSMPYLISYMRKRERESRGLDFSCEHRLWYSGTYLNQFPDLRKGLTPHRHTNASTCNFRDYRSHNVILMTSAHAQDTPQKFTPQSRQH